MLLPQASLQRATEMLQPFILIKLTTLRSRDAPLSVFVEQFLRVRLLLGRPFESEEAVDIGSFHQEVQQFVIERRLVA